MGILLLLWRNLPDALAFAAVVLVHAQLLRWAIRSERMRARRALRVAAIAGAALLLLWAGCSMLFSVPHFSRRLPSSWLLSWTRGAGIAWSIAAIASMAIYSLWRRLPGYNPGRRGFLRVAGGACTAAPFAVVGFGVLVDRSGFRTREVDVRIPNLPRELHGLRLVQLTDIHLSPFLSEKELARAVDMANELKGNIAVVTGDLVTSSGDPLDTCLRQVARLRAEAGIYGCLGNHEVYARVTDRATAGGARLGIRFLRQQSASLRFRGKEINLVGVDYQRMGDRGRYLRGADKLLVPGATNILLSHNPDVFDAAARQGFDLTVSGHTHGGQVTVEILNQTLNVARFYTPYVYGLYQNGNSSVWVSRGIGTVGLPARIGAPPEVVLLRLCAI